MGTNSSQTVRVLVVDDSAFMRKAISMMLESDPSIKVIGTARNGEEGVEKTRLLKPDLVTMDIEMPRMDGLTALREIMAKNPVPVMMISSITTEGAQATLDALEMGAVDFIPKQMSYVSLDIVKIRDELIAKIKDITRRKHLLMSRFRTRRISRQHAESRQIRPSGVTVLRQPGLVSGPVVKKYDHMINIIAVGASTGGPLALQAVIPRLPRNLPVGAVIAQHMPPAFTKSLAERLNSTSQVMVREAVNGEPLEPGSVLLCPGGQHLTVRKQGVRTHVYVSDQPTETLYHPCVDILMRSVAEAFGRFSMGVILTGMGNNGAAGLAEIKRQGGIIIAQDENSSVVYGMPRAAIEAGLADHISPIDDVAQHILNYF